GGYFGLFLRGPIILAIAFCVTSYEIINTKIENIENLIILSVLKAFALALIPIIFISCMSLAGYLIGISSGLNFAGVIDPALGQNQSEISKILGDLTLFVFLLLGGHLFLLKILFDTNNAFSKLSVAELAEFVLQLVVKTFSFGVIFATPILGGIFLTNLCLGIVSKAVPSFNVFIMGYPLTLFLGVVFLTFFLRNFINYFDILSGLIL
ncbi:MAG: flagellar biosynthetic protein FliR, partial [Deltaproteobacteria bacterium]|nr:flagellar biosynthetic protein FliR [Deltaproteobacteria bacterium]